MGRMKSVLVARAWLVLGSAVLMSGCSALFMSRPPLGDGPLPEGTCATSAALPVLDVAMSAVTVVGAVANSDEGDSWDEANLAGGALAAAAWAYSAYKGFNWTAECRRRQALSEQAIADHLRTLARNAPTPDNS